MAFSKVTPAYPGRVRLSIETVRVAEDGSITPISGNIYYSLQDAAGVELTEHVVPVSELTANQRTTLTNLLTTIRTRIQTEAIG